MIEAGRAPGGWDSVLRTPDERFEGLPNFPFAPSYLTVANPAGGEPLRMHYVNEGPSDAQVVLALHDEVTWSYLYRKMIPRFVANGLRVVAPDLIGFGRSDKLADRTAYGLRQHVSWLRELVVALNLSDINLVCLGWGGPIGMAVMAREPDRFVRVTAGNTMLPTLRGDQPVAPDILAEIISTQRDPAFRASAAVARGTVRSMASDVLAAYDAPYPDERFRQGVRQLPMLAPLSSDDLSAVMNRETLEFLSRWERPFLTLFGDSDPATRGWERVFQKRVPGARRAPHRLLERTGHCWPEDCGEDAADVIVDWIRDRGSMQQQVRSSDRRARRQPKARIDARLTWDDVSQRSVIRLYAGDIPFFRMATAGLEHLREQYEGLVGLSINRNDEYHVLHDLYQPLPLPDNSVSFYQSEEVFHHLEFERLPEILDEIHRVLRPGALLRLSFPDYGCDVLRQRSLYDAVGRIVFDPGCGGSPQSPVSRWFGRIDMIRSLIESTKFATNGTVDYLHYYEMDGTPVVHPIDYSKGYVARTPDHDPRVMNPYRPMSMVIDLTKAEQGSASRGGLSRSVGASPVVGPSGAAAMDRQKPTVEILYITWNRLPYTKVTLPIVLDRGGDIDYRVVVVDNGSTDGTVEYLQALEHPRLGRLILNNENLGIAPVTNAFWALSAADYLGKVDNDIFLPDRWLESLMRVHDAGDPAVGVVGLTHFKRSEIDDLGSEAIAHNVKTLAGDVQVFVQDHIGGACHVFPRRLYDIFGGLRQQPGDLRSGWPEKQREFYLSGYFPCYVYPWVTCVHMGDPTRPDLPNIDPPENAEQMAERKRRHQDLLLATEPGRDWDARKRLVDDLAPGVAAEVSGRAPADPLVSVVLTSHNYARYLGDAIESVLAQTYGRIELIIVDDGSTDESPRIIDDYVRRYPDRIQAITRTENWGISRSYNQALERVSGSILAGISSDDAWAPSAVETWVRFFDSHPDVDVVATDFDVVGPDGAVLSGPSRFEMCPQFKRYPDADFATLYVQLLRGNFIPDVVVATSLRRIGKDELRYDERCSLVSDWDLYLRLAKDHRWAYLPERTVFYRWHGENMSSPQKSLERRGDVIGQHLYVLGKALATTQAVEQRTIILEQIGRFWGDYTAMLVDAGVPDVAQLPGGAAANERDHLRERVAHLESERARQQARAEALEHRVAHLDEERARQQARAEALEGETRSLAARVRELESANALRRTLPARWLGTLRRRMRRGRFDHQGLFDPEWYAATYPDVAASGMDPFAHYVQFGAAEGRDPGPKFDTDFYLSEYPDVVAAGINPLEHYVRFGRREGRHPRRPERSAG